MRIGGGENGGSSIVIGNHRSAIKLGDAYSENPDDERHVGGGETGL